MTIFIRVAGEPDKADTLRRLCADVHSDDRHAFVRDVDSLLEIPGAPLAYWAAPELIRAFRVLPSFESTGRFAGQGVATADNFRFLRLYWETPGCEESEWFGLAKGGAASAIYSDIYLCIRWGHEGAEFKAWAETLYDNSHWSRITMNYTRYGLPGLTWSRRATGFAARTLPARCVFGDKGPAVFTPSQTPESLLATCAVMNSASFRALLDLQLARVDLAKSFETGAVSRTPFPVLSADDESYLAGLARQAWNVLWLQDSTNEVSHAFTVPARLPSTSPAVQEQFAEVLRNIDERVQRLYGFSSDVLASQYALVDAEDGAGIEGSDVDASDTDSPFEATNLIDHDAALLSWCVGVAFGRFDERIATGERAQLSSPGPFDPLSARSPGMWPEGESRPIAPPDILVDDAGHARDLHSVVGGASALIGSPEREHLREWLAREFFPLHIKMYSKSRRKAPIYWQLATPSASYSVWLYVHAFTKDTLYKVQNDYVAPKLAYEERTLESLRSEVGESPNAAERKALAAQETFVDELRAFLDEVKRIAPLWNPDLDDGVIINFAPLWRLVPQHKPWQKELKAKWDELAAGKYDWAHLAMHLWPERVVPKCATDRSLAIAHGLEDVFWVEGADGKWKPRATPLRPVEDLVRERSSPAVKAALKNLLDAPTVSGNGRARGGRRAASAAATEGGSR